MKVLFLTRYARLGASSRYRMLQYVPYLQAAGWSVEVHSLLPRRHLQQLYGTLDGGRLATAFRIVLAILRRAALLVLLIGQFDVVFVQYEAFPYLPWVIESIFLRRARALVLDYDDAMHVHYGSSSRPLVRMFLGGKIQRLVARADRLVFGSRSLMKMMGVSSEKGVVIPTSVQMARYDATPVPARPEDDGTVRIVWIGTPVTAPFLHLLDNVLSVLARRYDIELRVIGATDFTVSGVRCITIPWSERTEIEELKACDIGVMPLPETEFARGKSGLKLIQYMASGIAVVASARGANLEIIAHKSRGLLAKNEREWLEALTNLIERSDLRRRIAQRGKLFAHENYAAEANASLLMKTLEDACTRKMPL